MEPSLFLKLAPQRRQVLGFGLRQALDILQMPQLDLGQWLINEIEKNPLLELKSFSRGKRIEIDPPARISLFEHLLTQIRETFLDRKERRIAQMFLEQIDERGFLPKDLEVHGPTKRILSIIQTFDPPGIFARDLRECLLTQLKLAKKSGTLTYQLIEECFEDLLHGRYTRIKKKLGLRDLGTAIKDLSRMSLRPASAFEIEPAHTIHVDLRIQRVSKGWTLELVEEDLPAFHMQDKYLGITPVSDDEKGILREFETQAKWIFRSLNRRRKLLKQLGKLLITKQAAFLKAEGPLKPLTMKEVAETLEIHESTLSRALSSKYAETPRGILPIRSLITKSPQILSARETLEKLIRGEDKLKPLTDDQLGEKLKERGFRVARRTIAKYRKQLKIGTANQRKHFLNKRKY